MKVTGLSALRRSTCAAVNGLAAVTVPATPPVPGIVDSAAKAGAASPSHANAHDAITRAFRRSHMAFPPRLRLLLALISPAPPPAGRFPTRPPRLRRGVPA